MLNFLEMTTLSSYNDNWNITFYIVLVIALGISFAWTLYKMHKEEKRNDNAYKMKENKIYNHSEDMIEMDVIPKRKIRENVENYYDVYQNKNRKQSRDVIDLNEEEDIKPSKLHDIITEEDNSVSDDVTKEDFDIFNTNDENIAEDKLEIQKPKSSNKQTSSSNTKNNKTKKNNNHSSKKKKKKKK